MDQLFAPLLATLGMHVLCENLPASCWLICCEAGNGVLGEALAQWTQEKRLPFWIHLGIVSPLIYGTIFGCQLITGFPMVYRITSCIPAR